jgi:hypothetical protein
MKTNKETGSNTYKVTIELNTVDYTIKANDIFEARSKALEKLKKKNVISLISRCDHVNNRRIIKIHRIS